MKTVLIVEDDKLFRTLIRDALEDTYIVLDAITCARMMEIIQNHAVNMILLDLSLPDGNSCKYIKEMKEITHAPIIILTASEDEHQAVKCLDLGADDYVKKPFNIQELEARIRAQMRHNHKNDLIDKDAKDKIFTFGKWRLEPQKYQLFDENNQSGNLTFHEFQLLYVLIQNKGGVLSREVLCEALREDSYVPTPRTIDVRIARLRRKVCDDANNPKYIKTVRGAGYTFSQD